VVRQENQYGPDAENGSPVRIIKQISFNKSGNTDWVDMLCFSVRIYFQINLLLIFSQTKKYGLNYSS